MKLVFVIVPGFLKLVSLLLLMLSVSICWGTGLG